MKKVLLPATCLSVAILASSCGDDPFTAHQLRKDDRVLGYLVRTGRVTVSSVTTVSTVSTTSTATVTVTQTLAK